MTDEQLEGPPQATVEGDEVATAEGPPPATVDGDEVATADKPPKLTWRRRLVLLLVVLTCFGVLTSSIAIWTHRTLLNTDQWVETVGPVAQDPAVQQALAVYITDQLMEVIDAQQLLTEALPPRVDFLATPLSTAIHDFVQRTALALIQSDQFQRLWVAVNRYGHQAVVNFLRGDSRLIQADDGVVTLNILPLLARTLQFVQEKVPRLLGGRTIPDLTYDMPVSEQNQQLSQALGRQLKPEFGVFTLFKSDQLAAAQKAITIFDKAVWALVIITIALAVAAIVLSVRRWRTLVQLGGGIALSMAVAIAAIGAVKNMVLDLITDPTNRSAVAATLRELLTNFNEIAHWLLALGIVVVVAAFLSGDNRWARQFRALAARLTGAAASGATSAVQRDRSEAPFPWLAEHRTLVLVAGAVVAGAWLLLVDVTIGSLLVVLLLLAVYEGVVWLLSYKPGDTEVATSSPVPEPTT